MMITVGVSDSVMKYSVVSLNVMGDNCWSVSVVMRVAVSGRVWCVCSSE